MIDSLGHAVVADREVLEGTLGLRAPITISWHRDIARPAARSVLAVWGIGEDGRKSLLGLMAGSPASWLTRAHAFFT